MALNLENFLLKDIKSLFNDPNYSNVVIQVGRHPDTNSFNAHSLILRARSSYFRSALKTNNGQVSTLNLPDISPRVFEYILNGTINLNETLLRSIYFEMLIASSDLNLTDLIDHLQAHLLTNDTEWIHTNLLKLLYLTFTHPLYSTLSKYCQNTFNTQFTQIFSSPEFLNLDEQFLINIIERKDLQIDEIVIWEAVIRWGIGKLPSLSEDVKEWTNKDFIKLRKVVKNLLPHIRFFNISGLDHRAKIRPFKKILEKELREEIKDFFFARIPPTKFQQLPPRIIKDLSNENHNQINNQPINNLASVNVPLCTTNSRDAGNDDNDTNNASNSSKSKKDSHDIVARVKLPKFAILNSQKNPGFSSDLRWFSGTCTPKSYDKPIHDDKVFSLTDFEVFKVEKKSNDDGNSRKRTRVTRIEDEEDELDFDLDEGDYGGDNAGKRLKS
ncbi:17892_t:CDS:2 [Cetraspora pellucida]|uniref:17892_t:CDS:1 n=1 Tax=Cetraspora pellucida TaxID=1433469 RepID=A0A9N8ZK56_9GLOM|nr:17892_t:CDS:2 [Cetraspora pellucida]